VLILDSRDYKEYHTDTTVRFVVSMTPEKLKKAEAENLHKVFKLQSTVTTTFMCAFDAAGCLRKYESSQEILKEFYDVRLKYYNKRKEYMEGILEAESRKLSNQARYGPKGLGSWKARAAESLEKHCLFWRLHCCI